MLAKRLETLSVGSTVSFAGFDNLTYDGHAYDHVYLKNEDNLEEKVHIDAFNKYAVIQ